MRSYVYYILLLFLFVGQQMSAQLFPVQVVTQTFPPHPVLLTNYANPTAVNNRIQVQLNLNDLTELNREVRLKLFIEGQGINAQSTDVVIGAPSIFLEGGVTTALGTAELAPYFELQNLQGISPAIYGTSLPEGPYRICFEVFDNFTGNQVSSKTCAGFVLFNNDPPFLNLPLNGAGIQEMLPLNLVFQWTPRHINVSNVQYEFILAEIWDLNIDPQAGFLSSPPIFQTTTTQTTLIYDGSFPSLVPGRRYGWRVRAFALDGAEEIGVFTNNGFSEIFSFDYQTTCDDPLFPEVEELSNRSAKIAWQGSFDHLDYTIKYREKNANSDWYDITTPREYGTIDNLNAETTYEYKVLGNCTFGSFGETFIQEFTTLSEEASAYQGCSITPEEVVVEGQELLQELFVNDTFTAGDFIVRVQSIDSSTSPFRGGGYVTMPWLGFLRIAVEFENIQINTENQLIVGAVETTYDPEWGTFLDGDEIVDDVFGSNGTITSYDAGTIDIDTVEVDENGAITIIDQAGNEHPIVQQGPIVITDQNGDQWAVSNDGEVTAVGPVAEGGVPDASNTDGVNNSGSVNAITSPDVTVTFADVAAPKYMYDPYPDGASAQIKSEYDSYDISDGSYYPPYKAVSNSNGGSKAGLVATAILANGKTTEDIVFKTSQGVAIPHTDWDNNSTTLTLNKHFDFAKTEIIAAIKTEDSTANQTVAGAAKLWHLDNKDINVKVVSVNGATVDIDQLNTEVNNIYKKAGITFNITSGNIPGVEFEVNSSLYTDNGDTVLDIGDSSLLAQYTPDERVIFEAYAADYTIEDNQYYVFIASNETRSDPEILGFMPLKRQYGFVFGGNTGRVLAHELGHGVFGLQHYESDQSDEDEESQDDQDFLMSTNYAGEILTHANWQTIHEPGIQLYLFQGDEDGQHVTNILDSKFAINRKKYYCETGECIENDSIGKYYYGYLVPNGERIVLSEDYSPVFFHGISEDKYYDLIPGSLIGFIEKNSNQQETKYWSLISSDGANFEGYNNDYNYQNISIDNDDSSIIIGLPFADPTSPNNSWRNYKFLNSGLSDFSSGTKPILSVFSNGFRDIGLFDSKPIAEFKNFENITTVIGEEQLDITDAEFNFIRGHYFDVNQFTDVTTLLGGITRIDHNEEPEIFLIVKIAEIYNRHPIVFNEYTIWFDLWNVYALTQQTTNSITNDILLEIASFNKGEWDDGQVTSETINLPESLYSKWNNNISSHNEVLYDFYVTFTNELVGSVSQSSVDNIACLASLGSKEYDKIIECVERASDDEVAEISFDNRKQALKTLISYQGILYVDNMSDREESVVARLLKYYPSDLDHDNLLDFFTSADNIVTITETIVGNDDPIQPGDYSLWDIMFRKVDNSNIFSTGDNRASIISSLSDHYYKSIRFQDAFEERNEYLLNATIEETRDLNLQLENSLYNYQYDHENIVLRGVTYLKSAAGTLYPAIYDYDSTSDQFLSIDTEIIGHNQIRVEQNVKWGYQIDESLNTSLYGPFDLAMFSNISKIALLRGYTAKDENGEYQMIPVPGIVLHYASSEGNVATKTQIIEATIDVGSFFIPGGQLNTMGKIFYYTDKISSLSSLAAMGLADDNPQLSSYFTALSIGAGIGSMGDLFISTKKINQVLKLDALDNFDPVSDTEHLADFINATENNQVLNQVKSLELSFSEKILNNDIADFRRASMATTSQLNKMENALQRIKTLATKYDDVFVQLLNTSYPSIYNRYLDLINTDAILASKFLEDFRNADPAVLVQLNKIGDESVLFEAWLNFKNKYPNRLFSCN